MQQGTLFLFFFVTNFYIYVYNNDGDTSESMVDGFTGVTVVDSDKLADAMMAQKTKVSTVSETVYKIFKSICQRNFF